jgi:hypothetical protein
MNKLTETVTVVREVSWRIADLVYFARSLAGQDINKMTDEELINRAHSFWDTRHGED